MTGQERDCGELLSRVLHSTTDQIEPVGDGLTKIQARLAEPWLNRQWWLLRHEFIVLGWVLAVRCQSWFSAIRSSSADEVSADDAATGRASAGAANGGGLRSLRPILSSVGAQVSAGHLQKAGAPLRKAVGPAMAWLRPALAVAGAVVLVVAGVFALAQIQGTFASFTGDNTRGAVDSSQTGGPGNTNGQGGLAGQAGSSPTQGSGTFSSPGSTPSSKVSASPTPCPSPSSQSASPSPSPSPASPSPSSSPTSASPTSTPTTASPTPSTSSGAAAGGKANGKARGHKEIIKTIALVTCGTPRSSPASQTNQTPGGP